MKIYMNIFKKNIKNDELFIEEGGRVQEASFGIKILADEIISWVEENDLKDIKIMLPSGTGTTALFFTKIFTF